MSKKRSTKERKAAKKAKPAETAGAGTVPGTEVKAQAKARSKKLRDDGTMSGLDAAAKVRAEARDAHLTGCLRPSLGLQALAKLAELRRQG